MLVGVAAVVGIGAASRYPAAAAAPVIFSGVQWLFRGVRFDSAFSLSPLAWASYTFGLQLVAVPVLIAFFGPTQETLPWLPSDGAINGALLLQGLAYIAFASGVALSRWSGNLKRVVVGNLRPLSITVLLGTGLIGLAARFGSLSGLIDYATGHGPLPTFVTDPGAHATLSQAASDFMLPCLSFGLTAGICLYAERLQARELLRFDRLLILITLVVLSTGASALYQYNRAAILVPAAALVAAWSVRKRRISYALLLAVGLAAFVVFLQLGSFRDAYYRTRGGMLDPSQVTLRQVDPIRTIQVYSNGPQFLAFALENSPPGTPFLGGSLIASALSPVPAIGRNFRDQSGSTMYNDLIYGKGIAYDQIIPFHAELWWNFGLVGVAAGFVALGLLVNRIDKRFRASQTLLSAYIFQFWGIWLCFLIVGAPAVLAQVLVYSLPPMVLGVALTHIAGGRGRLERSPKR
jgi:hypothetical protein